MGKDNSNAAGVMSIRWRAMLGLLVILVVLQACTSRAEVTTTTTPIQGVAPGSLEGTRAIFDCLRNEKGLAVEMDTSTGQPGIGWDENIVSSETVFAANDECIEELRDAGVLLTDDELYGPEYRRNLYQQFLGAADCIRGLGYDVPDAPSEEAFVEGTEEWYPFDAVPGVVGPEELNRVYTKCGLD